MGTRTKTYFFLMPTKGGSPSEGIPIKVACNFSYPNRYEVEFTIRNMTAKDAKMPGGFMKDHMTFDNYHILRPLMCLDGFCFFTANGTYGSRDILISTDNENDHDMVDTITEYMKDVCMYHKMIEGVIQ